MFLDKNFSVKVANFAGSSLDGAELLVTVAASHENILARRYLLKGISSLLNRFSTKS